MISLENLKSVCNDKGSSNKCHLYVDQLNQFMALYGIDTPLSKANFLAQVLHESNEFKATVENLNYSATGLAATWPKRFANSDKSPNNVALSIARKPEQIANIVYANRMGNGDVSSGDGWKYRGRGLIQLTGKTNYDVCSKAIGIDIVNNPDKVTNPEVAVETACWFWKRNNLSHLANEGDFERVTRLINGGVHGLESRLNYYKKLLTILT